MRKTKNKENKKQVIARVVAVVMACLMVFSCIAPMLA